MSSVGHLMVGAAAGRYACDRPPGPRQRLLWILLIGISILPDIDLVLPALGVSRALTLGHRGATHSLAAALAVTAIVTLLAIAMRLPARRAAIGAFVAIGSHAILDTLTPGPGVAWLWPFSTARLPTFPIVPMTPVGEPFNAAWLVLFAAEVIVFSPFLAYAVMGRRGHP